MEPSPVSIRVYLKDINDTGELPQDLSIYCSGVPRIGDTINVFEILPEEDRQDSGWWYAVEEVEWTMRDTQVFEPILKLRKNRV